LQSLFTHTGLFLHTYGPLLTYFLDTPMDSRKFFVRYVFLLIPPPQMGHSVETNNINVMHCAAACCHVLQYGAWYIVVQCVAMCCRVLYLFFHARSCPLNQGWVWYERTCAFSGIQFTTHSWNSFLWKRTNCLVVTVIPT